MTTVVNELAKRDLEWSIINTKGQNVPLTRPRKTSPTLSASITKPSMHHNIDAVKSLDQHRQDSRRTAIHVESMSVTADNKGNWRVSGLVNGISVSAKAVERDDAVNDKKGIMSKEEMAEKYNLHVPPKQQTKVTRKNEMTRSIRHSDISSKKRGADNNASTSFLCIFSGFYPAGTGCRGSIGI